MTHLWTFILCLAGFGCLSLAMDRHQQDVFGHELSIKATRLLRTAGWALLVAALAVIVQDQGWSLGLVSYSGHTSLAAGVVFVALVVRDRLALSSR